jgi:hypothetical protein
MIQNQRMKMGINVPDLEGEIWRQHPLGRLISNMGRMKMIYKSKKSAGNYRITKGHLTQNGYRKVTIGLKKVYMHRLVLEAFTSIDQGVGMIVDHIDRNKLNNNLDNLRWATYKENAINRDPPKPFKHCCTCTCVFE